MDRSEHQRRVEEFMRQARQTVPVVQTMPDEKTRLLRCKLVWEEALEFIEAMGFVPTPKIVDAGHPEQHYDYDFVKSHDCADGDLSLIVDGACDLKVVTTGSLSACGVPDLPFQRLVDLNNLAKFGPGHSWREDGKLIKPPDHKPPDIKGLLKQLGTK